MAETKTPTAETAAPAAPAAPAKKPVKKKNNRRKVRNILILIAVLAALAVGGWFLVRFLNSSGGGQGEIFSQSAVIGAIQSKVSGSGTAKAKESAAITLTQSGTVQEVFVTAGQTVAAGDPLYQIFSQAAEDAVAAARDRVSSAREKVTEAQKRVKELTEDLEKLNEKRKDLTVKAPFAGKLVEVGKFRAGEDVGEGAAVATLVNDRKLRLSLYFSYAYDGMIAPGQRVEVSIPAAMASFIGAVETVNRVHYISPEGADHFEAVVVFDNPGTLTEGMSASAALAAPDGSAIYPYANAKTEYYEVRKITTKAAGPLLTQDLLRYADVEEGQALMTLGSKELDEEITDKREEIRAAEKMVSDAVDTVTKEEEDLTKARKALEDFNAVAPIDGTVISCNLNPGAEVKSGDTVVMISNTTTMLVTINVDDRNISFIKPGSYVDLDWNGNMYQGLVTAIDLGGAQAGQGMTNYPVTLSVENVDGSLMDGAWLQYSFVTSESSDCVLVPTSAVKYVSDTEGNRKAVVFVRRDARPEDVPELDLPTVEPGQKKQFPAEADGYYPALVETGLSDAQNVEITSGVEEGDEVFVNFTVTDSGSSWG